MKASITPDEIIDQFTANATFIAFQASKRIHWRIPLEDLRQEALIAALKHAPRYRPDMGATLKHWVNYKMQNAVLDAARGELHSRGYGKGVWVQSIEDPVTFSDGSEETIDPGYDPWSAIEASIDLATLMEPADKKDREIILEVLEEVPQCEIARKRGLTDGRISQILSHGLIAMRKRCARRSKEVN